MDLAELRRELHLQRDDEGASLSFPSPDHREAKVGKLLGIPGEGDLLRRAIMKQQRAFKEIVSGIRGKGFIAVQLSFGCSAKSHAGVGRFDLPSPKELFRRPERVSRSTWSILLLRISLPSKGRVPTTQAFGGGVARGNGIFSSSPVKVHSQPRHDEWREVQPRQTPPAFEDLSKRPRPSSYPTNPCLDARWPAIRGQPTHSRSHENSEILQVISGG